MRKYYTAMTAPSFKERASLAIRLIKSGRTHSRAFSSCFEMGDDLAVIAEIVRRAKKDPEIEKRYPHVAVWRNY